MEDDKLKDPIKAAITWEVLMRSGEASIEDQTRFAEWHAASAANRAAWQSLQQKLTSFRSFGQSAQAQGAGRQALLNAGQSRRRMLRNSFTGVVGLAVVGALGYRGLQACGYDATLRTGTGELREAALNPDIGVTLDAGTIVDATATGWRMESGQMLVNAMHNRKPFDILSARGNLHASAARFSFSSYETHSLVAVVQGSATLTTPDGMVKMITQGDVVSLSEAGIERSSQSLANAVAWTEGLFVASDQAVADVIGVLRRHRQGVIRVTRKAAAKRVSGIFNMRMPDAVLRQLAETVALKVESYGRFLVTVSET
ncbi:Fe2+-dicitrate sensor protein [Herbaspirillum rubrisubalbicans]|uniref:Fe2+-dicitrate sensor protein n=1 Tax=Herbaspirillum rubrisubalbicans TaxID=80842 RepID=A0AAD0XGK5_9BURK|nr:Fe2+-dicitrate sensor protein [Herbaspirillum rubrisubalbicans]